MFLLLGLTGMKMSHKLAGVLGTLGMGTVLVLSYYTAFTYYFSGNPEFIAEGVRQQAVIFNVGGSHSPKTSSSGSDSSSILSRQ